MQHSPSIPHAVSRLIAWRTLSQLIIRRPGQDLRLFELHPGGGSYCLAVAQPATLKTVLVINPSLNPLVKNRAGQLLDAPSDLFHDALEEPLRTVERIERLTELGSPTTATSLTAQTLPLVVLTTLLERTALGRRPLEVDCGWRDSSDGPNQAADWAHDLPACVALREKASWKEQARAAGRYWRLSRPGDARSIVVDLSTSRWWDARHEPQSLWQGWCDGETLRALAGRLELALG